nr:BON domain-containing protein [Rhodoferax sp.]
MRTAGKLLSLTLALTCVSAMAVDAPPSASKATAVPQGQASSSVDNTNINKRDKGGATKTPQNQSNSKQDRELLAAVRRAIVGDKSLSSMAHNVKVVVDGGAVTLRGPVKSAEEKAKVEELAKHVNGITATDNQLDVKTDVSTK